MKQNGNNLKVSDYYIGLDIGTNSVGWAATDLEYGLLRFKGNSTWGVRLFEEAKTAAERRVARTGRRRLDRRKQRLALLELLFSEEITKIDPAFFVRFHESSLVLKDKSSQSGKYALFNDKNYTDKDYLKQYPTIYHLRSELIHSDSPHDVRLVFLALHHIIKSRGHFLLEGDMNTGENGIDDELNELIFLLETEYGVSFEINNRSAFDEILVERDRGINDKKKALRRLVDLPTGDKDALVSLQAICDLLAGASVKLVDLFPDDAENLKEAELKSISLKTDLDEVFNELSETIGERTSLVLLAKKIYDSARLRTILGDYQYLSDAKIEQFKKNKNTLKRLKSLVKNHYSDKYQLIFSQRGASLDNYAAYSGYKLKSGEHVCTQDAFCQFLKKQLVGLDSYPDYQNIAQQIDEKTLLPKLKGSDNGVIPNQIQSKEFMAILDNASCYLPFLTKTDENGKTVKDKLISLFSFRVPYYVGPLNNKSPNSWIVRTSDKIYPWNFEEVVDLEQSASFFITNMIGKCTYTGDQVLPLDSLLYSKYMVLNEINPLKVNGKPVPVAIKQRIYEDLFMNSRKKVTKKGLKNYLLSIGEIEATDELSGVDDVIKSRLKSYHDFSQLLARTHDEQMVEEIIKSIVVFGDDKKMLKRWLRKEYKCLTDSDIAYLSKLKYTGWGRLSRSFLSEIYSPDENGEALSIIDVLWRTNDNLMQLLSERYLFMENAALYRQNKYGGSQRLDDIFEDLYITPAVRRSVRQSLRIVDEIVDVRKSAPKKIFIEVARDNAKTVKKQRTESRKNKLIELYKACGRDSDEIFMHLESEPENRLRSDKLFLYYSQFGKCMYTGEDIDIEYLINDSGRYDIDHIFPRSRVKDDSLDNRVLVKAEYNRDKTNEYPIKEKIRKQMYPFWKSLREKGMISEKKYIRLTRNTELTDQELADFVSRQIVETQQSTKALAQILRYYYPETRVVWSKAGNVTEFREKLAGNMIFKCRETNDLHHAKDAYLNIVVGNVYDEKFTKRFFTNIRNEKYSLNRVFDYSVPGAWDASGTSMAQVVRTLKKNNVLFTRMAFDVKGALFDLQLLQAGKGQLEQKQGKDIGLYGGYNKLSGAFFAVIEHTKKNKRIQTIETVYLYKQKEYESDPKKYCTDVLGLCDPEIICDHIGFNALLEIDGARLQISSRTGDSIVFKHAYQFVLPGDREKELKDVIKYVERCKKAREELLPTVFDGVSEQKNIDIYDWFIQRLTTGIYSRLFSNMRNDMIVCRSVFCALPVYKQCVVLTEVLKAFKCDAQNPNFELLNGKKTVGRIQKNKALTSVQKMYLINQSITGLFEYRTVIKES